MTFDRFLEEHLEQLARYAAVLTGDRQDAHDLLGDVLVEAQGKWERIGSMSNPMGYVRRIVLSRFVDDRRRAVRTSKVLAAQSSEGAIVDRYPALGDHVRIAELLTAITPRQKAAIVLRYYLDLSDSAIADELSCSTATVRSLVARGLSTLRALDNLKPGEV